MEEFFVRAESVRAYYAKLSEPGPGDKEQYNREAASIQHITRKSPEIEDENADLNEYSFMRPLDPVSTSILAKRLALELHTDRSRNGAYDGGASPHPCRSFETDIGSLGCEPTQDLLTRIYSRKIWLRVSWSDADTGEVVQRTPLCHNSPKQLSDLLLYI